MEQVAADAHHTIEEPMGPVGQAEVMEAVVVAVAAHRWACGRLEPQLLLHQPQAAAHGALVHGQGQAGFGLRSGQFEQIQHMQILQK